MYHLDADIHLHSSRHHPHHLIKIMDIIPHQNCMANSSSTQITTQTIFLPDLDGKRGQIITTVNSTEYYHLGRSLYVYFVKH